MDLKTDKTFHPSPLEMWKAIKEGKRPHRYVFALVFVLIGLAIRVVFLRALGDSVAYITFYPAVVFAALYGGLRPGLLAGAVSALVCDYFWVGPGFNLDVHDFAEMAGMTTFLVNCALISWAVDKVGKAQARIRSAEAELLRSKAESALAEARQTLESIMKSTTDAIFVKDLEGRYLSFNPAAAAVAGTTEAEILGRDDFAVFPEELARKIQENEKAARERTFTFEEAIPDASGGTRVFLTTKGPLRDPSGKVFGTFGIARDITERKRAEQAFSESAGRLSSLYAAMTEGVAQHELVYGQDGKPADYRLVEVNPAFEALTGLAREKAVGKLASELYGTGKPPYLDVYARVAETGKPREFEVYFEPMKKHFKIAVFSPGKGRFATVFEDITVRKRFEEALRESELKLRRFYEAGLVGIVYWNLDGRFTGANDKFLEMTGYTRQDLEGGRLDWLKMTPPEFLRREELHTEELKVTGANAKPFEKEFFRKDGSRLPVLVAGAMLDEARSSGVAMVLDITARKKAERALRDSEERLQFALETIHTGAWDLNLEDRSAYASAEHARIFGYSRPPADWSFEKFIEHVLPEDRAAVKETVDKAAAAGRDWNLECRIRREDGAVRWILAASRHRTTLGHGRMVSGIVQDITERKLAQLKAEELHRTVAEEKEKLSALISSIGDEVWFSDAAGKFTLMNPSALAEFGLADGSAPEVEKFAAGLEVLRPDHTPRPVEEAPPLRALRGEQVRGQEELVRVPRTGELRHRLVNASPVKGRDGATLGVVSVVHDITELKRAEEAALLAKEEWERTFDSVPDLIAILDNKHRVVRVNKSMAEHLKREPAQCAGLHCYEAVHGLGMPHKDCPHAQTIKDGQAHHAEVNEPNLGGFFMVNTVPLRGADGKIQGAVHVAHDITARKRAENELLKLNRYLTALSDSGQAMLRAVDEETYIKEVCRIIVEIGGHPMVWVGFKENDANKSVRPVAQAGFDDGYIASLHVTWDDSELGRGPTGTAVRTGKTSMCRNMLTDPKFLPWREAARARGYASSIVLPLRDGENVFGAISIYSAEPDPFTPEEIKLLEDLADDLSHGIVTLRLRAQSAEAAEVLKRDKETLERLVEERSGELLSVQLELERAKRLADIGTLAATVAHELRNPLASITLSASNIRRKAPDAPIEKNLANIEKKILESDQIITNLLFYSRIRPPIPQSLDLAALLEECAETAEKRAKVKAKVHRSFGPVQGLAISADATQLAEVFSNILNNSLDALPAEGGEIRIQTEAAPDHVLVTIRDNGHGIPKEIADKIFDPFFTTKSRGTGLGLSVCRQIVERHGGKIEMESAPGAGTAMTVCLPRA